MRKNRLRRRKSRNNSSRKSRWAIRFTFLLILFIMLVSVYGYVKPLPEGVSYEGNVHAVDEVDFLYDLTTLHEQEQMLFAHMFRMIEEAEDFIILDLFLFNDEYNRTLEFPSLSLELTEALVAKKQGEPQVDILFITDRINTFYGSYESELINMLKEAEVQVVFTDMKELRDSNPLYSGVWRTLFQWFGTSGNGWLPNPFSPDSPKTTLRSYLDLLNFKANHRKVVITEKEGFVTSANPHDASANHSNIGFSVKGELLQELVEVERAVARFSGAAPEWLDSVTVRSTKEKYGANQVQLLTEGKIKKHLLKEIAVTDAMDKITIGAFYLSDRDVITALIAAADRGAEVKLVLDANKDAFGREKNGVPNRPVAHELVTKSEGRIQIRWYKTNGEQYHSKIMLIEQGDRGVLIGGSANFTKRNLDDFNLELNLKVSSATDSEIIAEARNYFERIWSNEGAIYTADYEVYEDDSLFLTLMYRFQEWSGLSSF